METKLHELYGDSISYVGEGSQWKVYRVSPVNSEGYIIKINKKCDESRVDNSIENYLTIKSSGMKTLSFVRKSDTISYAYECEDLNPGGDSVIYISPNTVRGCAKEKHILDPILKKISKFKIKNFEKNIEDLVNDVQITGRGKDAAGVSEDAIFIGVILNEDSTLSLTYKIADFDTICQKDEEHFDFSSLNRESMLTTLWEFFEFCVNIPMYKTIIEEIAKL